MRNIFPQRYFILELDQYKIHIIIFRNMLQPEIILSKLVMKMFTHILSYIIIKLFSSLVLSDKVFYSFLWKETKKNIGHCCASELFWTVIKLATNLKQLKIIALEYKLLDPVRVKNTFICLQKTANVFKKFLTFFLFHMLNTNLKNEVR